MSKRSALVEAGSLLPGNLVDVGTPDGSLSLGLTRVLRVRRTVDAWGGEWVAIEVAPVVDGAPDRAHRFEVLRRPFDAVYTERPAALVGEGVPA